MVVDKLILSENEESEDESSASGEHKVLLLKINFSGFIEGFGVRIRPVVISDQQLKVHYPQYLTGGSEQGEEDLRGEGEMGDDCGSSWRSSSSPPSAKRKIEDCYDGDDEGDEHCDRRGKRRNF